ncbi:MAG TPA: RagB/SusD family nutrient uptake outer membrane protein [Puia sp.]|nr:RagB/SusD family nutrient uptake outer membrane protein [Puia sp.]
MNKFFIYIAGLTLLTVSCKKSFLDEHLTSKYTPGNTLVDSLGFEAAIAGLQAQVRSQYTFAGDQGLIGCMYLGTDMTSSIPVQSTAAMLPYYQYATLSSTDLGSLYYWQWAYTTINNANLIIQGAESAAVTATSAANKAYIDAEAKFYRAYAYNFLATLWGPVPLITIPLTAPRINFTRTTLDSVNAQITQDLNDAVATLPTANGVRKEGRPNIAMAQQLLAEVYLRLNKPDLAKTLCQTIIGSGVFSLTSSRYGVHASQAGDYYSDMFVYGNQRRGQGNKEAIWVIEQDYNIPGGSTTSDQHRRMWVPAYYGTPGMLICDSLGGRGIGRMRLSRWIMYNLYDNNDMRNSIYNIHRTFYYNDPANANYGKQVVVTGTDTLTRICPSTTKWNQYNPLDQFGYGTTKDLIMMRLGETWLLLAEAQFKLNDLPGAAASINALRQRAYPDYPLHGQVQASDITLDFILDERARELVAEENRRMTLVRTGTLLERVQNYGDQGATAITGLTAKNLLLPIPQTEIDLNKDAVLTQNTGY